MENDRPNMDGTLALLSRAPERELDESMCQLVAKLVGMDQTRQKEGVRYILDTCVHAGLASTFTINALDTVWIVLGGKLEDVPSEDRGKMPEFLKN